MARSSTAYLGLGSNLGDRLANMSAGVAKLDEHPRIQVDFPGGVASLYETSPVGGPIDQPRYLNSVVRVMTTLPPMELLDTVLSIEASIGRTRAERWGPRAIDIDLLLYDNVVLNDARLTLPHPRLHQRRFVLIPLCEIAADTLHPLLAVTVTELIERLGPQGDADAAAIVADPGWCKNFTGSGR